MENPQAAPHTTHHSPPRYESAAGLSTRQIIDSASYTTTPSGTPPNERSHVFSARDGHRAEPSVAALADADRAVLERSAEQGRRSSSGGNYARAVRLRGDGKGEMGKGEREGEGEGNQHQTQTQHQTQHASRGVVPPYMLKSIAASEKAGAQARDSARQTLAVGTAGRDVAAVEP